MKALANGILFMGQGFRVKTVEPQMSWFCPRFKVGTGLYETNHCDDVNVGDDGR